MMKQNGRQLKNAMKLMIDTNVVLDYIFEREVFYDDSEELFIMVAQRRFEGVLSTKSIADIHNIAKRKTGDEDKVREIIRKLTKLFTIVELAREDCINALHMEGPDYEDNLIISTAERIKADVILTRNLKDFKKSSIPAQPTGEFLTTQEHSTEKTLRTRKISKKIDKN